MKNFSAINCMVRMSSTIIYYGIHIISPHMYFKQRSTLLESQTSSKFTSNLFNRCTLQKAFEQHATSTTDPKTWWDTSMMKTHPTGVWKFLGDQPLTFPSSWASSIKHCMYLSNLSCTPNFSHVKKYEFNIDDKSRNSIWISSCSSVKWLYW